MQKINPSETDMKTSDKGWAEKVLKQACEGKKKERDICAQIKNEDTVICCSDWRYFDFSDRFCGIIIDSRSLERDLYLLYL
jgi:hypothetical protein